ncbi:MAG: hypothetical protein ACN6OP_12515 [Pseudomonadales bacterium]
MMKRRARGRPQRWFALFAVVAALSACGDYGPDMRAELGKALPTGWHVDRFRLDEWEVIDWAADHWSYSYTAQIAATEDLYREVGTLSGQTIVARSERKNGYHVVEGRALAALRSKGWDTDFGYGRVLAVADGKALSAFPATRIVVGTPRFETFLKAAQQDLVLQQDELREAQRLFDARSQKWSGRSREAEDAAKRTDQALVQEQLTLRRDRMNISSLVSPKLHEADRALQLEYRQKLDAHRNELDRRNAALREAHRSRVAALRARIDALEKSVSRSEFSHRVPALYDEERVMEREYRNALDQAFARYQSDLTDAQKESEQRRARLGGDLEAQAREDLDNREAALNVRLQQRQDERQARAGKQAQDWEELERVRTDLQRREGTLSEQQTLISRLIANASAPPL